jgi:glutathione S-transferase
MKLYGALLSPFVRKVAVILEEKALEWELALSSPGAPDPDFQKASPFGKIPALCDGDYMLADSSAIAVYLDAKHPSPAVLPTEPQARGKAMWFDEFADTIYGASGLKVVFNRLVGPKLLKLPSDEAIAVQGESELPRILDYLESVAPEHGWLDGEYSLGDISVASMLKTMSYVSHGPDAAKYPRTAAWYGRVAARPAWASVAAMEAPIAERLGATG